MCQTDIRMDLFFSSLPLTIFAFYVSSSVSASDCDSGENADLTYYTLSPDFTISPHGTIFPAGPLDYERLNHLYEFVVMAVDKGEVPRTGTTTVRIRMANVNDEAPDFSQHMYVTVSGDISLSQSVKLRFKKLTFIAVIVLQGHRFCFVVMLVMVS